MVAIRCRYISLKFKKKDFAKVTIINKIRSHCFGSFSSIKVAVTYVGIGRKCYGNG